LTRRFFFLKRTIPVPFYRKRNAFSMHGSCWLMYHFLCQEKEMGYAIKSLRQK
jgi:hypothetical protein